jgi:toxin ParE1/3/4
MAYKSFKIIVAHRAQKEIEQVIDYYALYSDDAPLKFFTSLSEAYTTLSVSPFYSVRYKNVRALKLKKFPFLLYFTVNETRSTVRILSCFHNKRNPVKRPRT